MEQYIIVHEEKRARDSAYSACAGERMENGTDRANRFSRFYVMRIFRAARYVNSRQVCYRESMGAASISTLVFPTFRHFDFSFLFISRPPSL
jgi:hypothetical protein